MLIVGLIIHCINKKKRREQMAVNNSSQMNGEGMNVSEIPLPQQSAAQAVYQAGGDIPIKPSKPEKHREPLSSSTVMLLIGTALVVLSRIAFGAANWLNTSPLGRVAIIMTASVVSFLISLLFGKGVKLKGTSIAFYIVGSLMIPVAMTVAGYYDLFGRWFSVFGGGRYLLFALGFAMTAAASKRCKDIQIKAFHLFRSYSNIYNNIVRRISGRLHKRNGKNGYCLHAPHYNTDNSHSGNILVQTS